MNIKSFSPVFLLSCLLSPAYCLADYTISPDGKEVTDTVTGLVWRRCSEGQTWRDNTCQGVATRYNAPQAFIHAKSEATIDSKPWRLPNVKELTSITKLGETANPSIDTTAFPATASDEYWTSTPGGRTVGGRFGWGMMSVDFAQGDPSIGAASYGGLTDTTGGDSFFVRLVR